MKGDTPRTDALERKLHLQRHVKVISLMTAHARQLERELNDAKALSQVWRNEIQKAKMERTRQQQILDALNKQ